MPKVICGSRILSAKKTSTIRLAKQGTEEGIVVGSSEAEMRVSCLHPVGGEGALRGTAAALAWVIREPQSSGHPERGRQGPF